MTQDFLEDVDRKIKDALVAKHGSTEEISATLGAIQYLVYWARHLEAQQGATEPESSPVGLGTIIVPASPETGPACTPQLHLPTMRRILGSNNEWCGHCGSLFVGSALQWVQPITLPEAANRSTPAPSTAQKAQA